MTLDELFAKYPDHRKAYRTGVANMSPKTIEWCKGLKEWGDPELRAKGYIIPDFMVEDAKADDWEIF